MTGRTEFPTKVKLAAFQRADGRCEGCTARLFPGKFQYDHVIADGILGEPTLENCRVLCGNCHLGKTRQDVKIIAKAKRREKRRAGIRKPRTICGWKLFDGSVRRVARER